MNKQKLFLATIAFMAGSCFLVFEVSWFRILSLTGGATVAASTLVISAFMAGLGIGAVAFSRLKNMQTNPLKVLSILLFALSIYGFLSYTLFFSIGSITAKWSTIINYSTSFILLFIPASLMGALIPSLTHAAVINEKEIKQGIGYIFGWETAGSAFGSLLCSFVLIRFLGQHNTILLASFVLLAISAVLFFIKQQTEKQVNPSSALPDEGSKQKEGDHVRIALIALFISGFVISGMQVVWFRFFKTYIVNTGYTFSLISTMVIVGLFLGSRYYTRRYSRQSLEPKVLISLFAGMLLSLLAGLVLLLNIHKWLFIPSGSLNAIHWVRIYLFPIISSLLVIIPPTFLSGIIFPFSGSLYSNNVQRLNSDMGRVVFLNSLGSALGPVIVAFVLVALFGGAYTILILAALLAVALLFMSRKIIMAKWVRPAIWSTMVVLFFIFVAQPQLRILPPSFLMQTKEIMHYKEYTEGVLVIGSEQDGNRKVISSFINNSAVIGSNYDAIKVVKMVGHLPFIAGLQCENVLVVGFGMGITTSAIASYNEVKRIDCVELVPGLTKTAHFYDGLNNNVQRDPRLNVMRGDGRHFLFKTNNKYDLISSDPTHPLLGSGNLYTKEYFELCKNHLTENGMVSQYLPLHKLRLSDFLGIVKTFHSVFPNATLWLGHYHGVLLGKNGEQTLDFQKWKANTTRITDPLFYSDPYHLAACMVQNPKTISQFPQDIRVNTDDRSYVEFFNIKAFNDENTFLNLDYLNKNRANVYESFTNIDDTLRMDRFVRGNILLNDALYGMLSNNKQLMFNKLQEALRHNPENEEFPFLLQFYFGR